MGPATSGTEVRLAPAASIGRVTESLAQALAVVGTWGAEHAAAALVGPDGIVASHGDPGRRFRWASVTKPVTAIGVLVATDRGLIDLDEPWGPPGSTVRHLLAHASGLPFEGEAPIARPGTGRIYSNPGFDALGELVTHRAGVSFEDALAEWVLEPLGMRDTVLLERPSQGLHGPLRDLAAFAREALRPRLTAAATHDEFRRVAFPGLAGVLPGVGRFDPLDWGLGAELRGAKSPHWTGRRNAPATYGHFGGAGTFVWVDPVLDAALVCLTDREFDRWALEAWPRFSDGVIEAVGADGLAPAAAAPAADAPAPASPRVGKPR